MRSMHTGVRHTCGLHMTGHYRHGSGVHLQHQCAERGELRHDAQVHDVAAQGKLQRLQRKPAPRVPTMLSALPCTPNGPQLTAGKRSKTWFPAHSQRCCIRTSSHTAACMFDAQQLTRRRTPKSTVARAKGCSLHEPVGQRAQQVVPAQRQPPQAPQILPRVRQRGDADRSDQRPVAGGRPGANRQFLQLQSERSRRQ